MSTPPPPASPAQWLFDLHSQLRSLNYAADVALRSQFLALRHTIVTELCARCSVRLPLAQLLQLPCALADAPSPSSSPLQHHHRVCQRCLGAVLDASAKDLSPVPKRCAPDALRIRQSVLLCPVCAAPCVVHRTPLSFDAAIVTFPPQRRAGGTHQDDYAADVARGHIGIHDHLSAIVRSAVRVVCYYENERYNILNRSFASRNLLTADLRGPVSDEANSAIDAPIEDVFTLPNSSWSWLCGWRVDVCAPNAGEDGWMYAFNWPKTGILSGSADWQAAPSATSFVRRRRWHRVMLGFTDAVLHEFAVGAARLDERRGGADRGGTDDADAGNAAAVA